MSKNTTKFSHAPCYESHKPLKILNGYVYGGNCGEVPPDMAMYIALDSGQAKNITKKGKAHYVLLNAKNGGVPNINNLLKVLIKASELLEQGKSIHVGCIGGHGRTGLVLAAMVAFIMDEADPITYVRDNYCKKAVETDAQVKYLNNHFNTPMAVPYYQIKSDTKVGNIFEVL